MRQRESRRRSDGADRRATRSFGTWHPRQSAYCRQDFPSLSKDADPNIPILKLSPAPVYPPCISNWRFERFQRLCLFVKSASCLESIGLPGSNTSRSTSRFHAPVVRGSAERGASLIVMAL